MIEPARSILRLAAVALAAGLAVVGTCRARGRRNAFAAATSLSPGFRFTEATGERTVRQRLPGLPHARRQGAVGAGTYPSLPKDSNLEAGGYPVYVVVRGQRAMPPVGAMMSDDQVAAVVNYLRTHFGNQYQDAVTAEDVKRVRP